jgi:hypothetical protein
MTTTDTPRTDACPYCGDEPCAYPQDDPAWQEYRCGTVYGYYPSDLCREREARQKLEAEVERLKVINADMRNFLSKAIHNEGFNEEQALKFIYQ